MAEAAVRRRVTATDVARSLGISRATVGFVLNNTPGQTISEATRQRVLAEAERLGYRPHAAARALARGSSRVVLVLLPDWPLDFSLRRYLEEASAVLDRAGYSLVTWTQHADGRSRPLWETLEPDLVIPVEPLSAQRSAALRAAGVRLLFDDVDPPGDLDAPAFSDGPLLQVEHLHDRGHRRLGYARPADPRLRGLADEREGVVRRGAADRGMPDVVVQEVGDSAARATAAVETWRRHGVTAVAAYNDEVAAAVVGAALDAGHAVPHDLAVLGYDDSPLAHLFRPALSSVHLDTGSIGRYIAGIALWTLGSLPAAPEPPALHTQVMPRATT